MTSHIQISATLPSQHAENLSDLFSELGALAVTFTDAKDEPLFQVGLHETPLWSLTTIHALFDSTFFPDVIVQSIKRHDQFSSLDFFVEKIENKNWVAETQKLFSSQRFGDLWVCPQWEKDSFLKEHLQEKVVFIEPGLAFGTGTHPTTQLCLTYLATHSLKNKIVVDYGCGSGILALAACALKAKTVYATDHDDQALLSTQNNADYNHFKKKLRIVNTSAMESAQADVIVANILSNTLIILIPVFEKLLRKNGKLILSGILSVDADRVIDAFKLHFDFVKMETLGEWVLIEMTMICAR